MSLFRFLTHSQDHPPVNAERAAINLSLGVPVIIGAIQFGSRVQNGATIGVAIFVKGGIPVMGNIFISPHQHDFLAAR